MISLLLVDIVLLRSKLRFRLKVNFLLPISINNLINQTLSRYSSAININNNIDGWKNS